MIIWGDIPQKTSFGLVIPHHRERSLLQTLYTILYFLYLTSCNVSIKNKNKDNNQLRMNYLLG